MEVLAVKVDGGQLAAIEAGVDPVGVGGRIRALKAEREEVEDALAQLAQTEQEEPIDIEEACAVLDSLPDLAEADPKLRHAVYEAFRGSRSIEMPSKHG